MEQGNPWIKPAAYGIQGYGALLVEKIEGCYFNVVGLPLQKVAAGLRNWGINLYEYKHCLPNERVSGVCPSAGSRWEMLGAEQLSDQELLAILLATGSKEYSALDLAERLLQSHKGLPGLRELSLDELMEQKGIGAAKATTIAAAIELGKRICYSSCDYRPVIASPSGAAELLQGQMRYLDREHFQVMLLNQKKAVLSIETISIGTLSSSLVHPREVFKPAIKRSASTMILAHNHPSGRLCAQ